MPCTNNQKKKIIAAGKKARKSIGAARESLLKIESTIEAQTETIDSLKGDRKNDKQRIALQNQRKKNIPIKKQRRKVVEGYEKDIAAQDKMNKEDVCKLKF
jgi:hypothetical protein